MTTTPTPSPQTDHLLLSRNLAKTYPGMETASLRCLDFSLRPGQALGLLGPNGAGKTTALSILSTRLPSTSGTLHISGVDAFRAPQKVRRMLGLVPQDIALYPELTGRENLEFFGGFYGLSGEELASRIQHCLSFVLLEDVADRQVANYSGGMKRRLNLATALLHDPSILLLDEPTVGIDTKSRNIILDSLSQLVRQGAALIYTTHYLEEIERICDTVIILDAGEMLAHGTPEQLLSPGGERNLQEFFEKLTDSRGE